MSVDLLIDISHIGMMLFACYFLWHAGNIISLCRNTINRLNTEKDNILIIALNTLKEHAISAEDYITAAKCQRMIDEINTK